MWTKIKFIADQGILLPDKIYINFEYPIRRDDMYYRLVKIYVYLYSLNVLLV